MNINNFITIKLILFFSFCLLSLVLLIDKTKAESFSLQKEIMCNEVYPSWWQSLERKRCVHNYKDPETFDLTFERRCNNIYNKWYLS